MANPYRRPTIIKSYARISKRLRRLPTMDDLISKGHTKDSIKHYFSSLTNLNREARTKFPEFFFDVNIEDVFNDAAIQRLRKQVKRYKRFVVTTAVTGCVVSENFYNSLKNYCRRSDALLLLLVAADPAHIQVRNSYGSIDKRLSKECIVFEDVDLNSNLFISAIKLSAKHIDPTTGLDRIGQRAGSFVFASPKQRLHMVATSNTKLPHALMTTGAITLPNYRTDLYMSERTAYIADADHVMGALILEIEDDNTYHYRQVQARDDGSFVDVGRLYTADGRVKQERPAAIVLGDWHAGETDPQVRAITEDMICALKPETLVVHDAFNGQSINHHEENNLLSKAIRYRKNLPTLQDEMKILAQDLQWMTSLVSNVVVVKSNHDEFLCKHYLQKAKYAEDPQNHYYALDLAKAQIEEKDPLEFAVMRELPLKKNTIRWLQRDEDYRIAGVQLGAHGDKGPNGSRGSLRNIERAYKDSVTGHSHTPGILRGAWAVGTSSLLKLNYNEGPSSWLHTHCIVYADGSRQLINLINRKWKM